VRTSDGIAQLATALAAAQGEIQNPKKERTAKIASKKGDYEYTYADLATVLDAVRPALSKNGIAIVQVPFVGDPREYGKNAEGNPIRVALLTLTTRLLHKSGEWIEHELAYDIDPDDRLQALGSSITFLRRYALQTVVGIASEEDDDGHAGGMQMKRQSPPEQREQRPPEQRRPPATQEQPPVKAAAGASPRAAAAATAVNDTAKAKHDITLEYGELQKGIGKPFALKFWQQWKNDAERVGPIARANVAIKTINARLGANAERLISDLTIDRKDPADVVGILADLEKAAGIEHPPY